jgi:hypothetical protein
MNGNKKFVSKKGEMRLIENSDLDCGDCIFAYDDSTIECVMYNQKPLNVVNGAECKFKARTKTEAKKITAK